MLLNATVRMGSGAKSGSSEASSGVFGAVTPTTVIKATRKT